MPIKLREEVPATPEEEEQHPELAVAPTRGCRASDRPAPSTAIGARWCGPVAV